MNSLQEENNFYLIKMFIMIELFRDWRQVYKMHNNTMLKKELLITWSRHGW